MIDIMNKKTFIIVITFLSILIIFSYFIMSITNNQFTKTTHNNTIFIISEIPPKIDYLHYQKIILITNKSYNYSKEYRQDFYGVIPTPSNFTPNNTRSFHDNITISNIKFGFYTIKIAVNETIYTGVNITHNFNYTIVDKLYLGNGTVLWT